MVSRKPKSRPHKRRRPSARKLAEQADRILEDALQRERDYQRLGITTVTISRAELIGKLSGRTAHSPFLTSIGRSNAVRGTTFLLIFGLMNPDPFSYDEANLGLCYCWSDAGGLTATFRLGPADLNYFLYQPNAFNPAVQLARGTMRVVVT